MTRIIDELNKRVLVIDGAMGTQLMERGVRPEDGFDQQNITRPEIVAAVHQAYVKAGADIIETNTFGANRLKLADYDLADKVEEINLAAARLARQAIGEKGFVAGSVGPLGKMIEPLGEVTFDQAYAAFAEQAKALEKGGVDIISVETISDLQEMRAAVIAVKQETKLPVIASLTYDDGEKTIYGTPVEAATVVLEGLGADVIGANCSTGPEGLLKVCRKLSAVSRKFIMVMQNAGMPELIGNKAVYKMTPAKFAAFAPKFLELGVRIIGGCCGTTPEHIAALKSSIPEPRQFSLPAGRQVAGSVPMTKFSSRTKVVSVYLGKPLLVGERINPSGRKLFQAEIKNKRWGTLRQEAESQTKAQAEMLDVNISVPETAESEAMAAAVRNVQAATDLPLAIDSPNLLAMEAGLKTFCGKALLNSVNGKPESLARILPLAKKYGAGIIALALDDKGLPNTAQDRLRLAARIVEAVQAAGIPKEDIFVDCLVMTAGVGIQGCFETLKAIPIIKANLGVKTILGISNVSHGLPSRSELNALYLKLALAYGLDAAIVDVTDRAIHNVLKPVVGKKILNREALFRLFKEAAERARRSGKPAEKRQEAEVKAIKFLKIDDIKKAVVAGDAELVKILVGQALAKKLDPQKLIDQGLIPGMELVGKKFNKKEFFLPQVIEAAEAMRAGFALCQEKIPKGKSKITGKVILATVKGDIHDIGKNIVKIMLENHGFQVVDLGKDVPPARIIAAARKDKPDAIALSALLTTTMIEMGAVKEELTRSGLHIPLIVGGAVVTKGYADRIGANYSLDAVGAVAVAKKIMALAKKRSK